MNTATTHFNRTELDHLMRATHLPDSDLPFHGRSHPQAVLAHARTMSTRLREAGISLDEVAIERGLALHDSLSHLPPELLGFRTPEELAGAIAYRHAKRQGASEREARTAERVALATSPLVCPRTPEEIVARASDLGGVGGVYEEFREGTERLYRESMIRTGRATTFAEWLPRGIQHLGYFMWPMLALTPAAYDAKGRSAFHVRAIQHIIRIWQETYGGSRPVTVEVGENTVQGPTSDELGLWIVVTARESVRERLALERMERGAAGPVVLAIPGCPDALPLPDQAVDRIVGEGAHLVPPQEASRVSSVNLAHVTSPPEPKGTLDDSLRGWCSAIEAFRPSREMLRTVDALMVPMHERYRRLKRVDLLGQPVLSVRADLLLADTTATAREIAGEKLFAFIEPTEGRNEGIRWHGVIARDALCEEVTRRLAGVASDSYTVTVQAARTVIYNANVLVGTDGSVRVEFSSAAQIPSRANTKILFWAWRDELSGLIRYSTQERVEREAAYTLLRKLPGTGEGRERIYLPGYYEAAMVRDDERIIPLFFDFRSDPFFIHSRGLAASENA